jgi:branched-chain amino acid transport system substrate-binding protein
VRTLGRNVMILIASLLAATAANAEIKIGFVSSLSGPAASIGVPYSKGIAAAFEYAKGVNGEQIKLIQLDDGSDPSTSTRNARKLAEEDKVDLLIGTASAPSTIAMVAVANELKVPMIAIAPITAPKTPDGDLWAICMVQPPILMSKVVTDRMARMGLKNVGYIGFSDAWGDLVYNGAKASEAEGKIKILTNERYTRTDTSVTGQVLTILAAHPDSILLGGAGTQGALPAIALRDRGYKGPLFGTPGLLNADFVRVGGQAVEGIVVSAGPAIVAEQLPDDHFGKRQALAFRKAYDRANGALPIDGFSPYSFDAWLILLDAASRAMTQVKPGTTEFRGALRNAIFETTDLKGALSIYNFRPGEAYGADERGFVLVKLENGAWKYVP